MDIRSAQRYTREKLIPCDADDESDYLLSYLLNKDRAWLYAHSEYQLDRTQSIGLKQLIRKRKAGKPLAYLKGCREFYGLNFYVDETVLIPRPETEIAVAYAIDSMPSAARLLDLGCGCANIAIAIAYHRPDLQITASDLSVAALDIARDNAKQYCCDITFIHSDWYQSIEDRFDGIIANPPYIAHQDPDADHRSIAAEPKLALYAEDNGIAGLKAVITDAKKHLRTHGILLVEHGRKQVKIVAQLMHTAGFKSIHCLKDASRNPRYTIVR